MADVTMPMNGKVIAVKAQVGQKVEEDDELVIIEAMKMELPVVAVASRELSRKSRLRQANLTK